MIQVQAVFTAELQPVFSDNLTQNISKIKLFFIYVAGRIQPPLLSVPQTIAKSSFDFDSRKLKAGVCCQFSISPTRDVETSLVHHR